MQKGWDIRRLFVTFLVIFVALVSLVRNATVRDRAMTNDRFLTKATKKTKITNKQEPVAVCTDRLLSRLVTSEDFFEQGGMLFDGFVKLLQLADTKNGDDIKDFVK